MLDDLKIPPEVEDAKNLILYMWVEIGHARLGDSVAVEPDSTDVYNSINMLSQYLWKAWENELSKKGFTRRKFLRLMRYRTDDVLLWAYDRIPWRKFMVRVIESIEGPMGKTIVKDLMMIKNFESLLDFL